MLYLMTVSKKITFKGCFLIVISCWEYSWVDCSRVYSPCNIIISRDSILLSLFLRMDVSLYACYCIMSVKGTFRPDWIYMRVVPLNRPWKEHQPLYVLDYLISLFNIWKDFKVLICFLQNWIQPPACSDYGRFK